MNFSDSSKPKPPKPAEPVLPQASRFERLAPMTSSTEPKPRQAPTIQKRQDSGKLFAMKEGGSTARVSRNIESTHTELNTFQDRLRMGKTRLCNSCGGVMTRSSRMILSAPAGIGLVVLGVILMALHGFAINFYQPPWFLRYLLPAAYYVGSIMIGVGLIFFFIREKIWRCSRCGEIHKR